MHGARRGSAHCPAGSSYCDGPRCARTPLRLIGPGVAPRNSLRSLEASSVRTAAASQITKRAARADPRAKHRSRPRNRPHRAPPAATTNGWRTERWRANSACSKGAGGWAVARNQARRLRWPVLRPARLRASSSCSSQLSERSSLQASAASSATRAQDGTAQVQSAPLAPTALSRDAARPHATLPARLCPRQLCRRGPGARKLRYLRDRTLGPEVTPTPRSVAGAARPAAGNAARAAPIWASRGSAPPSGARSRGRRGCRRESPGR